MKKPMEHSETFKSKEKRLKPIILSSHTNVWIPGRCPGPNPDKPYSRGFPLFVCPSIVALMILAVTFAFSLPAWAKSRTSDSLKMSDGFPLFFDELCDILAQGNFKAGTAIDAMMETRDPRYRDTAMEALGEIEMVLNAILKTPNLPERIPETVKVLLEMQTANRHIVRRMSDRLNSFLSGRRAISSMLEAMDHLMIEKVEPLIYPARTMNPELFKVLSGFHHIEVAAFQMPWGTAREAGWKDQYAGQKARKTYVDALTTLENASSELDAWFFAKDTHLFTLETNRQLAVFLPQLRQMAEDISDQVKTTYDSNAALNQLYTDFSANVCTLDKLIISDLLISCFF